MLGRAHVASTVFLVWHVRFCEKVLLRGLNFISATCCVRFSWFEFVRYELWQMTLTVCMALANCSHHNKLLCFIPLLMLQHVFYAYTRRGLSKLNEPAPCPLVYADQFLSRQKNNWHQRSQQTNRNSNNEIYFSKYVICNSSSYVKVTTRVNISSKSFKPTLHIQ